MIKNIGAITILFTSSDMAELNASASAVKIPGAT